MRALTLLAAFMLMAAAAPVPALPPVPPLPDDNTPSVAALSLPPATVPVLMHDLSGTIVKDGTLIAFQADLLFDGATAVLHDEAAERLVPLVQLMRQIHPAGLRITGRDPADPGLARRRAASLQIWLEEAALTKLPISTASATGAPGLDVLIVR